MRITRRHLLALSAGTTAAAALVAGGIATRWWNQPADAPFDVLNQDEAAFVRAWASAAYPANEIISLAGEDAGLDRFFDQMLKTTPADAAKLLRLLLHALDTATYPTEGMAFSKLAEDQRQVVFTRWINSDIAPFRSATQSLVLLLGMGWSIHPDVAPHMRALHSCGYGS